MGNELGDAALVAFSGGQDSSTALAWALSRYARVETVGFSYGQKHAVEMTCRENLRRAVSTLKPAWEAALGLDHKVQLDLIGQLAENNVPSFEPPSLRLMNTLNVGRRYIPGRNLLLLSMCSSVAFRRGIDAIVYGVSETEYSGYHDCTMAAIRSINSAINESTGLRFVVETPLMRLTKCGVWELAEELGGIELVDIIREYSHTCYGGDREVLHEWGFGCGQCAACVLRRKGWSDYASARASTIMG